MNKLVAGIIIIIILILVSAGIFLYFQEMALFKNKGGSEKIAEQIKKEKIIEETRNDYNSKFPDVLSGEINIVSDEKTTLTTESGKEYLISPARPMSFYRDSGIENNMSVKIRGKLSEEGGLFLGSIVPVN